MLKISNNKEVSNIDDKLDLDINDQLPIDDDILNVELSNAILDKGICKKLLNALSENRVDDRDDWIKIGMALKNHSDKDGLYDVWEKWSKKNNKHKEGDCEREWKSFTKKNNNVKIGALLCMAKQDNYDKFNELVKELNIKKIIMDKKKYFPDNDLNIIKIITGTNSHHVCLSDTYCPILQSEHNGSNCYIEISKHGDFYFKCHCDTCRGKEFPLNNSITLSKTDINYLFNFTQNNVNITINESGEISSDKIKISSDSTIFDDKELNKLMIDSLSGTDAEISKVIYYLCKNKFNCTQDKKWYEFFDHKWQESEGMSTFMSDELVVYYNKVIKFVNDSQLEKADKSSTVKEVKKVIKLLKTKTQKSNIIDEVGVRFRRGNRKFYDKLDSTPYLIGFDNGVYDLNKMEFREGRPDDNISMSCGYDFKNTYSKYKKDLDQFLEEILPNEDDREYLLIFLASGLIGLNICELFTILTGKGRNGKSKFIDLVAITLGEYFGRPKCKLLTGTRPDENAPEPGLLSLKKKRTIMVSEPEKNDVLNSSFIKFITGNDSETLRKCHKNEMEMFKANFITFLVCNDIPEIDNVDIAFAKRLRCINFPTEFIQNPKLPHQKKIDETLQLKIPLWKNDFILLLLEHYVKFKNGLLKPSKNVLKWTEMYKEEVDKYLIFLNECTEQSEKHIANATLYDSFKTWFKNKYPGEKVANNREFLNGIRKHKTIKQGVKINGKTYHGIKHLQLKIEKSKFNNKKINILNNKQTELENEKKETVYILQLEHNKYYVGWTQRVNGDRFEEHFNGEGSEWTKKYKPIQVIKWINGTKQDEDRITLELMKDLGWYNVRGGKWCKVEMTEPPKELKLTSSKVNAIITRVTTKQKLKCKTDLEKKRSCDRCGRHGHCAENCYAKTDADGYDIEEFDDSEDSEDSDDESCYRCGRIGHYAKNCYARTDIDGCCLY